MQKSMADRKILYDPKEDDVLVAPAGGTAEAHFRCANPGNPNVAYFALQVEGLPNRVGLKAPNAAWRLRAKRRLC